MVRVRGKAREMAPALERVPGMARERERVQAPGQGMVPEMGRVPALERVPEKEKAQGLGSGPPCPSQRRWPHHCPRRSP